MGGMYLHSARSLHRFLLAGLLVSTFSLTAAAQEPKSAGPARELAALLAAQNLDSIAAHMPDTRDEFVGALTFSGQLLVVWARTTAPAVVNEKLIRQGYREVYMDLNSASVVESRHLVADLGRDGLRAKPEKRRGPADSHDVGDTTMRFDGNWREDKMSEKEYMKLYADADEAYAKAVQVLIDELKKGG